MAKSHQPKQKSGNFKNKQKNKPVSKSKNNKKYKNKQN